MTFKLEENRKNLNLYINGVLSYVLIRNISTKSGIWEAFKVVNNRIFATPVDSDRYRYDLAERLDLSK